MNETQLKYADYCINEVLKVTPPHSASIKRKMDYISCVESEIVIRILIDDNWIKRIGVRFQLVTDKYEIIQKFGSYSNYRRSIENENQKKVEEQNESMQIGRKLKLDTIENIEYQKTYREQEQRIRDLTEQLNGWSLIQKYWWALLTCVGLGAGIGKILSNLL